MKTKYIITLIFLMLSNVVSGQETLNRYIEVAAKNNPALKSKFNEYMASLEKIPQVGALPDPQLVFGYFIQPVETRLGPQQFKISLSQLFPWFGMLGAKKDIAIQNAKAKYALFNEKKSNLFFEVKSTYFDLYFIRQGIKITNNNIRILDTFKNLTLIKIESGTASGVDALRAEMELAELENGLVQLKDKWNVHSIKFNNLLNVPKDNTIEFPDTLWTIDLPYSKHAIMDSIKSNNFQISNLNFVFNSFRSKETVAKKAGMPNFSLGVDYIGIGKTEDSMTGLNSNGQDALLFPRIGISIPLYRKKYAAMVKESILMQQSVEEQKADKINTLQTIFEKVYSQYVDADRRILLYQKQIRLAGKAIKILEADYITNGKNFEEILRMEKQFLKYSLALERARSDKQASIAFIIYLMGK